MENVQELAEKLAEHKEQLAQIEELLKGTPDDAELLKLRDDLTQVIALTEDLKQPILPFAAVQDVKWRSKDRCMALYTDGKYYVAEVVGGSNDEYEIKYLEYGNTAVVPESSLNSFVPVPKDQLKKGAPIKAMSERETDGLFYDAVFMEASETPGNYMVRFSKLGKQLHEVSGFDIIQRAGKITKDPDGPLPDKPVIPDHVKIKKSDSEQTRENKKRKIKRIKANHRNKKREEEGNRKQNNWLSFMNNSKVKKHKSIFASSVEGTVGVMNSGKTMTLNKERTKHQFQEVDGDSDEEEEEESDE